MVILFLIYLIKVEHILLLGINIYYVNIDLPTSEIIRKRIKLYES